jgi:glycosyl transferase family 25
MWEFIDKIVYINLDHREDRRNHMKSVFEKGKIPEEKLQRFPAVLVKPGIVGCVKSHIAVLKMARENEWGSILILEDDIEWVNFEENYKKLEELTKTEYDVCILSGHYIETRRIKVLKSYTTGGYIVKKNYYDKLIQCFEESLTNLTRPTRFPFQKVDITSRIINDHTNHFDVYWNKLQREDNWIGVIPSMAKQINSYSDILYKTYTPRT